MKEYAKTNSSYKNNFQQQEKESKQNEHPK
jgi:hypothetical protein